MSWQEMFEGIMQLRLGDVLRAITLGIFGFLIFFFFMI